MREEELEEIEDLGRKERRRTRRRMLRCSRSELQGEDAEQC